MLLPDEIAELRASHRQSARMGQRGWEDIFVGTQLPVRFKERRWADLEREPVSEPFVRSAIDVYNGFSEHWQTGYGLTFIGGPGIGKTTAACVLGAELARLGWVVRYVTMYRWITLRQRLIELSHRKDDRYAPELERIEQWLDEMDAAHLTILDDVGHEHRTASGYAEHTFEALLRTRHDSSLPTVMTSNLPLKDWDAYSVSMSSFLHEATHIVTSITDQDLRRRRSGER